VKIRAFLILAVVAAALPVAAAGQALTDAQIEFTPEPPGELDFFWYDVRLKGIYDADTQTFDFLLGMGVVLRDQTVRLWGIDAWELRGPEKPRGVEALAYARSVLFKDEGGTLKPRPIVLRTYEDKRGKYGRWLVEVFVQTGFRPAFTDRGGTDQPARIEWVNLNEALVENGHAEVVDY
jgi:endonuclease YncB( thermonuclease family)